MWTKKSDETIEETTDTTDSVTTGAEPNESRDPQPVTEYRGAGIMWTAVGVVLTIALAVIVSFQNTQDVAIEFLWLDASMPLVLLLLVAVGSTVVVTEAIGLVWRRRRRHRLREQQELRELRKR